MKIAIRGSKSRGKEVIQTLESFGGKNKWNLKGTDDQCAFYIDTFGNIYKFPLDKYTEDRTIYTLECFEKIFPFKIGDEVIILDYRNKKGIIINIDLSGPIVLYFIKLETGNGIYRSAKLLKPYKKMKEERNITLTLEKAKEWYKKGGELKEIALQAYSEEELTKAELPKSWKEYCVNYPIKEGEYYIDLCSDIILASSGPNEERGIEMDRNICPSKESAEAHLAMIQLEQLRDCYNNSSNDTNRIAIINNNGNVQLYVDPPFNCFLTFKNNLLAREFFSNFKEIIEIAKELI